MRSTGKHWKTAIVVCSVALLAGLLLTSVALASNNDPNQANPYSSPTGVTVGEPIQPVLVDLREIASAAPVDGPGGNRELGQRSRITDEQKEALQRRSMDIPPDENVQQAPQGPGASAPTLNSSFDAIDVTDCCGGGTSVPPDPDLAAGPDHLIAVVNVSLEIYDKSGTILTPATTLDSFFAAVPDCFGAFDPTTVYDQESDRFAIGMDGGGDDFCIAVTTGSDPTSTWNIYAVPADILGAFHDYPHMGVGDDAIFVGANQFGGAVPGGFEGRIWALDKADMYAGSALTPITFSTGISGGTPQPLNLNGFGQGTWPAPGEPHYFVADPFDGDSLQVWEWPSPLTGGVPSIAGVFNLQTISGVTSGFPIAVPQSGGSTIEANDWRFRGFEYRNGSGWTADTISCNPGGGTVDCVRWTQVDLSVSPPVVIQSGVFSSDGEYRIFPDIAANQCNDIAVGFSKSSSTTFPGVWFTGRQSGDPLGTLQAEALLKAGEVTYFSFDGAPLRWGDYTGMTSDPDGLTFWYLGEYSKSVPAGPAANWGNFVGSFSYPDCSVEPLELTGPAPGTAGVDNTWDVTGATSGATVHFLGGNTVGPVDVPGCPGETVDIGNPTVLGTAVSDANGDASLTILVPASASGITGRFHAVEQSSCRVSNLTTNTFP